MKDLRALQQSLLSWYQENHRELPWRKDRDPYRIWISEVMLQQTTVTAVIPYYERFMQSFPTLSKLAKAPLAKVLEHWSGLGYYSRARNLHKSAKELHKNGFPRTYSELIQYPGFGPYTARAVTSLAFEEEVGVLDGNVIRVLSRLLSKNVDWWTTKGRNELQVHADQLVKDVSPNQMNQALMELGASLCAPTSPACLLCPWSSKCRARKEGDPTMYPKSKPRRAKEVWIWRPQLVQKRGRLALVRNGYAPFLKGQWLCPGTAEKVMRAPEKFHFRHGITHHEIYVVVQKKSDLATRWKKEIQWVPQKALHEFNPTSLMKKVLEEK